MNLMELQERLAGARGLATVKVKITQPLGEDGCVEVSCVETITNSEGQTLVLSDERGE